MSADIDSEAIDAAGDEIEAADESTTRGQRRFARVFMIVLTVIVGAALALLIYFGYVDVGQIIEDSSVISWVVQFMIVVAGASVCLFIISMVIKAVGGDMINRLMTGAAYAMDSYTLPSNRDRGDQETGDDGG